MLHLIFFLKHKILDKLKEFFRKSYFDDIIDRKSNYYLNVNNGLVLN